MTSSMMRAIASHTEAWSSIHLSLHSSARKRLSLSANRLAAIARLCLPEA
jgi:hypothetical protein